MRARICLVLSRKRPSPPPRTSHLSSVRHQRADTLNKAHVATRKLFGMRASKLAGQREPAPTSPMPLARTPRSSPTLLSPFGPSRPHSMTTNRRKEGGGLTASSHPIRKVIAAQTLCHSSLLYREAETCRQRLQFPRKHNPICSWLRMQGRPIEMTLGWRACCPSRPKRLHPPCISASAASRSARTSRRRKRRGRARNARRRDRSPITSNAAEARHERHADRYVHYHTSSRAFIIRCREKPHA